MASRTVTRTKEFKDHVRADFPTAKIYIDSLHITACVDDAYGDRKTVGVFNQTARRGWVSLPVKSN